MSVSTPLSTDDVYLELASAKMSLAQAEGNLLHTGVLTAPVATVSNAEVEAKIRAVSTENALAAAHRLTNDAMVEQMAKLTRVPFLESSDFAIGAEGVQSSVSALLILRAAA